MKYYIIAGEASGDLHASNLARELARQDRQAETRGWGGDLMREAGVDVRRHYKETAIMGFITVLKNLKRVKRNLRACADDIRAWQPDAVILVDYGGFNLRLAKMLENSGTRVYYYISPKIWAWNTGRVHAIKRLVERMYVIFPFEVDFYKAFGYTVYYAGNPLVDAIDRHALDEESFEAFTARNALPAKPIIALLAGSRAQEIKHVLPKMLGVMGHFPGYQFVIAGAPATSDADYAPYLGGRPVPVVHGQTYRLLRQARAALVTSGTATLETAILRVPQVVCYSGEGGRFFYLLFKLFVKVRYISLVNLIAGKEVVKELLMQQLNEKNLSLALSRILDPGERERVLKDYEEVNRRLGTPGASERVASMIIQSLSPR
ncbi:MAG: lipid-A-disaccharide synthase [Odoribacteraceae bacterium]|jgi:lipid-A-disaccharide synthase|nr:lipid-A-disaccharide synthase [Odoribacteraceae bacterium]